MRWLGMMLSILTLFALAGCSIFLPDQGAKGQPCTGGGLCLDGLTCVAGMCVDTADGDGDQENDTDVADDDTETDAVDSDTDAVDTDSDVVDTDPGDDTDSEVVDDDADTADGDTEPEADKESPGLTWVSVPGGSFQMGCVPQDTHCATDNREKPRHLVTVSAFQMLATEVTQDQYFAVTGQRPGIFSTCGGDCPVEHVTWNQANDFCTSVGGRLPSEAEWEYAARGDTTTVYYCGDDSDCLSGTTCNQRDMTCPVAQKTANDFGLYDMLGNVYEWVTDCWHETYDEAPDTGDVWSGGDCSQHVQRGGSYSNDSEALRASARIANNPADAVDFVGFRCVRDNEPADGDVDAVADTEPDEAECDPRASFTCHNGDVYWQNCNGDVTEKKEECDNCNCSDNACVVTQHDYAACNSGDVYWYSCHHERNDVQQDCGTDVCCGDTCMSGSDFYCCGGLCTDPITNFQWQELPVSAAKLWDEAITYCQSLDLEGGGWRLPNISELRTLVRNCSDIQTTGACGVKEECEACSVSAEQTCLDGSDCWNSSCNPEACTDNGGDTGCYWPTPLSGSCEWYWSSSTRSSSNDSAWYIGFIEGYVNSAGKDSAHRVRCVRDAAAAAK